MAPPDDTTASLPKLLQSLTSTEHFLLSNGKFSIKGFPLLSDVPENVTFSPFSSICNPSQSSAPFPLLHRVQSLSPRGGFLGFHKDSPSDSLLNSLGKFTDRQFLSIFRFKTWWSTMWVGNSGSDLQLETQWVLLNVPEINSYLIIIPIIETGFRSSLHPGKNGEIMISVESGSTKVKSSSFKAIAYVHVSENPYNLMKEAYSAIRVHLNTFRLIEEKSVPSLVDKFGWCTWDAFYLTVEPAGVWHGVNEFAEGGIAPRFLIIDDGWQSINLDGENPNEDAKRLVLGGSQMTGRLYRLDENEKFRNYKGKSMVDTNFDSKKPKMLISKAIELEHAEKDREKAIGSGESDLKGIESRIEGVKRELEAIFGGEENISMCCEGEKTGMKGFVSDLRERFEGLDDIYVWHALCGAWGGVRPGSITNLRSKIVACKLSPGLCGTMDDLAVDKIVEGGIGVVDPDQAGELYDSMHSYLASVGVTGVKVDVIHSLEYACEEYGGRVELAKAYYKGLSDSISKNFNGNGLISSMQQCNDFLFLGTNQISMGRVGDDFWFQDPNGDPMGVYWLQGVHMIHCAYNSLWMGQIIKPDWDMFQSDHLCAKFHAGSRAICGGPVYVSDSLGCHDFKLLNKLVYPDGSIPKCQHFAMPTRDCLFKNPLFDNKTVLKIWNFNKYGGVIGAFNCQGAGWDPNQRRFKGFPKCYNPISASIHVTDIEWDQNPETAHMASAEEYVVYLNLAQELALTAPEFTPIQLTLQPSSFELFSFIPIKKLGFNVKFAPIGLTNMFNNGGTIQELEYYETSVEIKVRGGGNFLAYSNVLPTMCLLNDAQERFEWSTDGKLRLDLAWDEGTGGISVLQFIF
ncbi:stachyose synthase [Euphorbia lathyris]|uniref:stachyose synthase n=1 Tax=Euphorbia lathyris TaxID=212925 RepID=UPI0033135264